MATEQIVQSLSYVTWALLGGLAWGSFAMAWLLRQVSDVTAGFVGFTAVMASLLGLLWLLAELSLPVPSDLAIEPATDLDQPRRAAIAMFMIAAFGAGVRLGRGGQARFLGPLAIGAGVAAMAVGAYGWTGGTDLGISLLVQLVALSAAAGGSLAAVVLAHWYLVTPRISERPLVLATRILAWTIAIQLLLFFAWLGAGIPAGEPFEALTGPNAVFVWLRLTVGLVFPLVLVLMAHRTALTRSMESATGLLYIELAAVLASTIVAAGLAFGEGLLV